MTRRTLATAIIRHWRAGGEKMGTYCGVIVFGNHLPTPVGLCSLAPDNSPCLLSRADGRRAVCESVGLQELEYYFRPPNQPIHMQPWLASVWRVPPSLG